MMKIEKITAFLLALTLISAFLVSCKSDNAIMPINIMEKLCESENALPSGNIYYSEASEGDESYLSQEILIDAYNFPENFGGISSVAIRPSSANHPVEFAVFLCKSTKDVQDVSLFCKERLKMLKRNAKSSAAICNMESEEYTKYIDSASIVAKGLYVALIISSDTENALKEFYRIVP